MIRVKKKTALAGLALISAALLCAAVRLRIDTTPTAAWPTNHPFVQTFLRYAPEFGGESLTVALIQENGDLMNAEGLAALKTLAEETANLPGVDRGNVQSLFSPNARYVVAVEDGLSGGDLIPVNFSGKPEEIERIKKNIDNAPSAGRLISSDYRVAVVRAPLIDKAAPPPLNSLRRFETRDRRIVITGTPALKAEIARAFGRAFVMHAMLLMLLVVGFYFIEKDGAVAMILFGFSLLCELSAFVFGGINHMRVAPATVVVALLFGPAGFACGWSSWRRLRAVPEPDIFPSAAALLVSLLITAGLLLVPIPAARQSAASAIGGFLSIFVFYSVILPIVIKRAEPTRQRETETTGLAGAGRLWGLMTTGLVLTALGAILIPTGTASHGAPELRQGSRFNADTTTLENIFGVGPDVLTVYAKAAAGGCTDPDTMTRLDQFGSRMKKVPEARRVVSLAETVKRATALWSEDFIKWRAMSSNASVLAQAASSIPPSSGLLNFDCSAMPVFVFLNDHKPATLKNAVAEAREAARALSDEKVSFELAGGPAGMMAAVNETLAGRWRWIVGLMILGPLALLLRLIAKVKSYGCSIFIAGVFSAGVALAGIFAMGWGLTLATLTGFVLGGAFAYAALLIGMPQPGGVPPLAPAVALLSGLLVLIVSPLTFQMELGATAFLFTAAGFLANQFLRRHR